MLIKPPEAVSQEMLDNIPYPITVADFFNAVLPLYPVKLQKFVFVNHENGAEIIGCPFNPPLVPIESVVMEAILAQGQEHMIGRKKNSFGEVLIETFRQHSEMIQVELGCDFDGFLKKNVEFVRKKKSSLIISSSLDINQPDLSGDGDILEVGLNIRN